MRARTTNAHARTKNYNKRARGCSGQAISNSITKHKYSYLIKNNVLKVACFVPHCDTPSQIVK